MKKNDGKTPASPLDWGILFSRMRLEYGIIETRAIISSMKLKKVETRNEQIVAFAHVMKENNNVLPSYGVMSKIFDVNKGKIHKIISRTRNQKNNPPHRPTLISPDQENTLIQLIKQRASEHNPFTPGDLRKTIMSMFQIPVSPSWAQSFLSRHYTELCITKGTYQENKRLSVPKQVAMKHIENLHKYVEGVCTELIFNLDEVGSQEWADKRAKRVIIPIEDKSKPALIGLNRNEKRLTICQIISMSGDTLMPLIISHRSTIDQEVWDSGIRDMEDAMFRSSSSSYITREIFVEYIRKVLFTYINKIREDPIYTNEVAVLLCDNLSAHIDNELKEELARMNIRLVTFPPHTSHIFQMLDLVIFGAFKAYKSGIKTKFAKGSQVDIFIKNLKALELATNSFNNRSAFLAAGIELCSGTIPQRCTINNQTLLNFIKIAGLVEGPSADIMNKNGQTWGFINESCFQEKN